MDLGERLEALAATADKKTAAALRKLRKEIDSQVTVVFAEGGVVQSVCSDRYTIGKTVVVDYDTDGADEADVVMIPQDDFEGKPHKDEWAHAGIIDVEIIPHDRKEKLKLAEVLRRIEAFNADANAVENDEDAAEPSSPRPR